QIYFILVFYILNKIVSTKRTSAIFLAIVLVAGTFAVISPSFMVGAAQAQPYYGMEQRYSDYEQDYGMDNDKKPKIFPANKVAELGDRWWQWGFGLDTTVVNPFTELGQAGCDVGLQDNGRLLFLVGTNKNFTTYPDTGFPVHECVVKKGTSILFPILNVACNNLEVGTPFFGANETEQRICANNFINATILESLQLEIDGKSIDNLEQYRVDSPAGGFEFTAVENNPFATPVGDGTGVSDGFWILLKDLKPGPHTISFSGAIDLNEIPPLEGIFEAGATYNLFVEPRYY
ncbi:MAG TPA: hypothetical protein VJ583_09215, partial [Nitrososphaeraceae archaeon]|nr:hypothetical protein [Nitrososphaeraceae archaeon]